MGVENLLSQLKDITETAYIREFAGKKVGVDAYAWLQKASLSCAPELCQNLPTNKYVSSWVPGWFLIVQCPLWS